MSPQNPYILRLQSPKEARAGVYYEIDLSLSPIGKGGMGAVYKGTRYEENTGVKREVAIKFLQENLPPSVVARAEREASIRLHNDNVVEMIDFVRIDQVDPNGNAVTRLHVVSELLQGVMLSDLLNGNVQDVYGNEVAYASELLSKLKSDRNSFAITICKKILSGVSALHDAGYIHRDIDPSNIMITSDGKIKIIDFGIAHEMGTVSDNVQLTHVGSFLGKPAYASPEVVLGDVAHQNESTDIYSIGILLFQLCTGKLPFEGEMNEVLRMQRETSVPVQLIEDSALRQIVKRATVKTQSARYQSAAEFRAALDKISLSGAVYDNTTQTVELYQMQQRLYGSSSATAPEATIGNKSSLGTQVVDVPNVEHQRAASEPTQSAFSVAAMVPWGIAIVLGLACGILLGIFV